MDNKSSDSGEEEVNIKLNAIHPTTNAQKWSAIHSISNSDYPNCLGMYGPTDLLGSDARLIDLFDVLFVSDLWDYMLLLSNT